MKNYEIPVSVIVCVYNGQDTIKRCLDSILTQTMEKFELIIIDDGSKDNTLKICQEYLKQDNRIRIKHQENRGPMIARKQGLELAEGKYILFLDADDWCENNMLEKMYSFAHENEADIVYCSAYMHTSRSIETIKNIPVSSGLYNTAELYKKYFMLLFGYFSYDNCEVSGYLWCCLFKNDVLENFLTYDVALHEDELIMIQAFCKAKKVYVTDKKLYHYNHIATTAMSNQSKYLINYWENGLNVIKAKMDLAQKMKLTDDEYRERYATVLFHYWFKMVYNETNYQNPRGLLGGLKYVHNVTLKTDMLKQYRNYIAMKDFFVDERVMLFFYDIKLPFVVYIYYVLKYKRMKKYKTRLSIDQKFQN